MLLDEDLNFDNLVNLKALDDITDIKAFVIGDEENHLGQMSGHPLDQLNDYSTNEGLLLNEDSTNEGLLLNEDSTNGANLFITEEPIRNSLDLLLEEFQSSATQTDNKDDLISEDNAFDVDSDEEMLTEITEELNSKGFKSLDDYDFNQFEILIKRADMFNVGGETNPLAVTQTYLHLFKQFEDFYNRVKGSYSMNSRQVELPRIQNHFDNDSNSFILSKAVQSFILKSNSEILEKHLKDSTDFTKKEINEIANNIYHIFKYNDRISNLIEANFDGFIEQVETVLISTLAIQKQLKEQKANAESYKEINLKYLLKREIDSLYKILETRKDDAQGNQIIDLGFIKQAFMDSDDNAYFICEKCGKKVPISDYVASCINMVFVRNGKSEFLLFPKLFTCECGFSYMFMNSDLSILETFIKNNLNSDINSLTLKLTTMSSGSAILKYDIPLTILKDLWSYLIVGVSAGGANLRDSDSEKDSSLKKKPARIRVSNLEYRKAVDEFYQLLKTLDPNKITKVFKEDKVVTADDSNPFGEDDGNPFGSNDGSPFSNGVFSTDSKENSADKAVSETIINTQTYNRSDMLSYKEIAMFFCKVLSINYSNIRNKAIFSIVFYINNNKVLREYLNSSNIYRLVNILKFIDSSVDLKKDSVIPTEEELSELNNIAFFYADKEQTDRLLAYENKLKTREELQLYCRELFEVLKSQRQHIENEVNRLKEIKEKTIKQLYECIDALAFLQIINITQFNYCDIVDICADESLYNLIDELVDRMIITNNAEDFFEKFKTFKIFSNSVINEALTVTTESGKISKILNDAVADLCESRHFRVNEHFIYDSFRMVTAMTQGSLVICKELNKAFNDADYYKFCQIIIDLCENHFNIETLISKEYTEKLLEFCNRFYKKAKDLVQKYPTPFDYYLQEFDKDEISLAEDYVKTEISFSRYMPKRNKDEGITEYLDRYEEIKNSNALNRFKYLSNDYGAEFDNVYNYYGVLFSCAALYDTRYHSFTHGTFITQFVKIVKDVDLNVLGSYSTNLNKKVIGTMLGISEPVLNIIDSEISSNRKTIDYNNFKILLKTLNGIYITSMVKRIDPILDKFYEKIVKNSDDLFEVLNKFKIGDLLVEIASEDEKTFVLYDDVPENTDYGEAVKELFLYSECKDLEEFL